MLWLGASSLGSSHEAFGKLFNFSVPPAPHLGRPGNSVAKVTEGEHMAESKCFTDRCCCNCTHMSKASSKTSIGAQGKRKSRNRNTERVMGVLSAPQELSPTWLVAPPGPKSHFLSCPLPFLKQEDFQPLRTHICLAGRDSRPGFEVPTGLPLDGAPLRH